MKKITLYICEHCGDDFRNKNQCERHEKNCGLCKKCIHAYFAYGIEFNCELLNKGGKCKFERNENEH